MELTILSEGSDLSYVLNDLPSLNDDLFKGTVRKSLHLAFKEFLISAYDPNRKVFKKPRKSSTSMKGRIEACVVKKEKKGVLMLNLFELKIFFLQLTAFGWKRL